MAQFDESPAQFTEDKFTKDAAKFEGFFRQLRSFLRLQEDARLRAENKRTLVLIAVLFAGLFAGFFFGRMADDFPFDGFRSSFASADGFAPDEAGQ